MRVNIQSVHFKADRKLETFINSKVEKLETYFDGLISGDVTLKLENVDDEENKVTEIKLVMPGNDLFAKKQCKTFEEATDQAVDALRRQLIRRKDRFRSK